MKCKNKECVFLEVSEGKPNTTHFLKSKCTECGVAGKLYNCDVLKVTKTNNPITKIWYLFTNILLLFTNKNIGFIFIVLIHDNQLIHHL